MTIDDSLEHHFNELSCDDNTQQRQQTQFHVVLVDIKKTVSDENIHCVEKPLEGDLKYVALSYRWGEVQETMIDTGVGYSVTITSFAVVDFINLCRMIACEPDLKDMEYVWVDAICVDQNNPIKRKTTIYKMSNIYEHANYILAVPDLHLTYLHSLSTKNSEILDDSFRFSEDIYYLIHGDAKSLAALDEKWLDQHNVPKDPDLRQLLTKYTDYFTDGLMTFREHHWAYDHLQVINHLYEVNSKNTETETTTAVSYLDLATWYRTAQTATEGDNAVDVFTRIKQLHHCKQSNCPLDLSVVEQPQYKKDMLDRKWPHCDREWNQMIYERSKSIRQSMYFMMDLIRDWSSRVWVISEFNIAKKNNNLKYWFLQLAPIRLVNDRYKRGAAISFFKFKFDNPAFTFTENAQVASTERWSSSDPVYLGFHQTMNYQLNEQTFFQMILQSKASKTEDRLYAILPLFQKYKYLIGSKDLEDSWKINTMHSLKLKLYKWMNVTNRFILLLLSGNWKSLQKGMILPTFATSTIIWCGYDDNVMTADDYESCNIDLSDPSALTLKQTATDQFFLHLKPRIYYVWTDARKDCLNEHHEDNKRKYGRLKCFDAGLTLDTICIPGCVLPAMEINPQDNIFLEYLLIVLVGNLERNIWIVGSWADYIPQEELDIPSGNDTAWIIHNGDDYPSGFHIY
ncbi:hypothetical protein BCR42DRAFT_426132 [Absidia repens]|uniref:Heterokaryon incompatibility domain-containing protein n=1 Tax=Absidia repens TaxID=90262 RepID=A0A1X2I1G5_9FUNG|nr:hypothetical protein BCR42DRAFT_426132 [Absidia repens]